MTKIFTGLCALLFTTCVVAEPIQIQPIDKGQQSIQSSVGEMAPSLDVDKLAKNPKRDFTTLAMGGIGGLAVGSMLSCWGIWRIEVLGRTLAPITGGLVGLYLANEGYLNGLRGALDSKP